MLRINRFTATAAIAAVFSMTAASASAIDLPHAAGPAKVQAWDENANTAENGRHRHRHRHGGGIDGGDILAGVLILGGIAAVASAVENGKDREYRDYPPPPPPQGGYEGRYEERYEYRGAPQYDGAGSSSGLGRAADICTDAIERTIEPVGSVDSVRRGAEGWDVDGTLRDGSPFTCTIGNDGQIRDIQTNRSYDGAAYGADEPAYDGTGEDNRPYYDEQSSVDGQYDDETYARLRAQQGGFGG